MNDKLFTPGEGGRLKVVSLEELIDFATQNPQPAPLSRLPAVREMGIPTEPNTPQVAKSAAPAPAPLSRLPEAAPLSWLPALPEAAPLSWLPALPEAAPPPAPAPLSWLLKALLEVGLPADPWIAGDSSLRPKIWHELPLDTKHVHMAQQHKAPPAEHKSPPAEQHKAPPAERKSPPAWGKLSAAGVVSATPPRPTIPAAIKTVLQDCEPFVVESAQRRDSLVYFVRMTSPEKHGRRFYKIGLTDVPFDQRVAGLHKKYGCQITDNTHNFVVLALLRTTQARYVEKELLKYFVDYRLELDGHRELFKIRHGMFSKFMEKARGFDKTAVLDMWTTPRYTIEANGEEFWHDAGNKIPFEFL